MPFRFDWRQQAALALYFGKWILLAMPLGMAVGSACALFLWSLDRATTVGSLETGKAMDAVIVDGDLVDLLRVGAPAIRAVIKRGDIVSRRGQVSAGLQHGPP